MKSRPVSTNKGSLSKRKCHSAVCLRPCLRPDNRELRLIFGKGNNNIAHLIIVTKIFARYKFINYYHYYLAFGLVSFILPLINSSSKVDQQYSTFVLSRIFAPAKRISTTTVLTARNFADNKTIDASNFTDIPSRNPQILTNFGEV